MITGQNDPFADRLILVLVLWNGEVVMGALVTCQVHNDRRTVIKQRRRGLSI